MKPTNQQSDRDCFVACIASLLHKPVSMFPVTYRKPANFKKVLKILADMGYIIMSGVKPPRRDRLHIASVPRFEPGGRGTYHAVISKNGKVVWDPATRGKMKKGSYIYRVDSYFWIEKINVKN